MRNSGFHSRDTRPIDSEFGVGLAANPFLFLTPAVSDQLLLKLLQRNSELRGSSSGYWKVAWASNKWLSNHPMYSTTFLANNIKESSKVADPHIKSTMQAYGPGS